MIGGSLEAFLDMETMSETSESPHWARNESNDSWLKNRTEVPINACSAADRASPRPDATLSNRLTGHDCCVERRYMS